MLIERQGEEKKKRVFNRAITQPFGSDILFSSQSGLDVLVPLMCYCQAKALVVDHCENRESTRCNGSLNDSDEKYW